MLQLKKGPSKNSTSRLSLTAAALRVSGLAEYEKNMNKTVAED
jgi:hypothetical protein